MILKSTRFGELFLIEPDELPTALPRYLFYGAEDRIRTCASRRILITSQAESTTVPPRHLKTGDYLFCQNLMINSKFCCTSPLTIFHFNRSPICRSIFMFFYKSKSCVILLYDFHTKTLSKNLIGNYFPKIAFFQL